MSVLPKAFKNYLVVEGHSPVTTRNYISDLNHFLAWFELRLRGRNHLVYQNEIENISSYFTPQTVEDYKNFLINNKLPITTTNRRLSTLRAFAKFCLLQNWIFKNPTKEIKNQAKKTDQTREILIKFRRSLEKEGISSNSIKNYLSDIGSFLTWLEVST